MILITGGTGFLGAQLTYDLLTSGQELRLLIRKDSNMRNLEYLCKDLDQWKSKIDWVETDLMDIYSVLENVKDCKQIYHCAAQVSFQSRNASQMIHENETITSNLVNALLETRQAKLCHVSSVSALGRAVSGETINEKSIWQNSDLNSNYAISKYISEREVWRGMAEGLCAVIVNPSIMLGPSHFKSIGMSFQRQIWNGLRFYTNGSNSFCDVRDVSKCMIQLMNSDIQNERFIVSSENISYKMLLDQIAYHLNRKKPGIPIPRVLNGLIVLSERIRASFSGKQPLITKETARTASQKFYYDNSKIKNITDYTFLPLDTTIQDSCISFEKQINTIY